MSNTIDTATDDDILDQAPAYLNGYPVRQSVAFSREADSGTITYRVLVERDHPYHPYVVATYNRNMGTSWCWGHYFETFTGALECLNDYVGKTTLRSITREPQVFAMP